MGCAFCTLLSNMFHAHVNVENCHSIKSIKYICKYVAKGSDMAGFGLADENAADEAAQYKLGRFISVFNFQIYDTQLLFT